MTRLYQLVWLGDKREYDKTLPAGLDRPVFSLTIIQSRSWFFKLKIMMTSLMGGGGGGLSQCIDQYVVFNTVVSPKREISS